MGQKLQCLCRHGPVEIIALKQAYALLSQAVELLLCLDTLDDDVLSRIRHQVDDVAQQLGAPLRIDRLNEQPVDLHGMEIDLAEAGKASKSGAEIVQPDFDPKLGEIG